MEAIETSNSKINQRLDKLEATKAPAEQSISPVLPSPSLDKTVSAEPSTHQHQHTTAPQHYDDCPTCHKAINEKAKAEIAPQIFKDLREKVKSMKKPVICVGCGEIVERENPKCTNCGSTEARKF